MAVATDEPRGRSLSVFDRGLYALFSRHADHARHERDRKRYRGTDLRTSFDVYLARVYGLSWVVFGALVLWASVVLLTVPDSLLTSIGSFVHQGLPVLNRVTVPAIPRQYIALGVGLLVGGLGKRSTVVLGGLYLHWAASARRTNIEQTLPGAVRYLRALSSGSDGGRMMLHKVANQDAYGETSVAFRKALNKASLTGSLDEGLAMVARDTPSRDLLSPFLVKFREHAAQGTDALQGYLRLESRMLSHRQARARERASGFLELLAEMFIVLLVIPALFVIILTVMSVLAPGFSQPMNTPLGPVSPRALFIYGSAAFVLVVGAGAAVLVDSIRPPGQSTTYDRPTTVLSLFKTATSNPTSAALVWLPVALAVTGGLWSLGYAPENVVLLGYVAYSLPVGGVAFRRARLDDAKDREIKDFIHAVSGHVGLGRPFPKAIDRVSRDLDLGALQADVEDLAFNINLTTRGMSAAEESQEGDLQRAALDRFVERVGTPLADQTIGLVAGALGVGSDTEDVFETLQTEIGRLYSEKLALRSALMVYVAVGWTTALLVIGIMVAVNGYVLDGFAQLSSVSGTHGIALDPNAVQPARDRRRFYIVTQATMLASGWFAGTANRDFYDALLQSGALVAICYFVFAGAQMI
ncbi:type II secretion system F family protein [Haladaptatus sp. CMSO5]|uniref:type II secretion system F family protein n=1 Tax=Haladaptatus sp. CMSO5 TaxID=3120514 RepID=UPI002FCE52EF